MPENSDMPKLDRRSEPMHEYMTRSVNVGLAATVMRRCLEGQDVKPQQERVALAVWNKVVPTLQAMAIQVQEKEQLSFHDISALMLTSGVNPDELWDSLDPTPAIEAQTNTSEKNKERA